MLVSIPVSQHERWQKQFEEAQNELRELREWKKEVLENPESMASKLDAAERRADSLAHMRKALRNQLDRKIRVAEEAHEAHAEQLRKKLLKKDEQLDQLLATKKEASEVAHRLEVENAEHVVSICDLQDEVQRSTDEMEYYRNNSIEQRDIIGRLRARVRDSEPELRKWQGISVRLNWLIEEMVRVGAIRLPEHEWATEMRHSIEYPNDDGIHNGPSIISSLPYGVRAANLPNDEDSHMEIVTDEEEEDDIYEALSAEASQHAERERRKSALIIQKMWRGRCGRRLAHRKRFSTFSIISPSLIGIGNNYQHQSVEEEEEPISWVQRARQYSATITIQKIWRGWIGRRDANREWWIQQTPTSGELAAATIQKMWRGYRGRMISLCWKMYDDDVSEFNARMEAVITIQKMWRGHCGRILPLHRIIRIDELYDTIAKRNAAAKYIQRVWRGFCSRGIVALKDPARMLYENHHLYSWKYHNSYVDYSTILRFINTGGDEYKWEKIDSLGVPIYEDNGIVEAHTFRPTCVTKIQFMRGVGYCCTGEPFIVSDGIVVKATHCVKLTNITTGAYRYIYIPYTTHGSFDENGHRVCYYDVATGISRPYSIEFHQMLKMWDDYREFPVLGLTNIPFFAQKEPWKTDE